MEELSSQELSLFSDCNMGCLCSRREWDPVCGENGITYVSPCLAGCVSYTGSGRNTVTDTHTTDFMTTVDSQSIIFGLNHIMRQSST